MSEIAMGVSGIDGQREIEGGHERERVTRETDGQIGVDRYPDR